MSMIRGKSVESAVERLSNFLQQPPPKDPKLSQQFLDEAITYIKAIAQPKSDEPAQTDINQTDINKDIQLNAQPIASLNTRVLGITFLTHTAIRGHTQVAEQLLNYKADPNAISDTPPLLSAAHGGHTQLTSLLLKKKANPNICDEYNQTALSFAIYEGHVHIIKELLKCDANPNQFCSPRSTPLKLAIEKNNLEILDLLLAHKADPNLLTPDGIPPIHIAQKNNPQSVYKLLEYKADPNLCGSSDSSILTKESYKGTEMVKLLLQLKADPNLLTKSGCTPLTAAASADHQSTITLLLESKADINLRNVHGLPPLSCAIKVKRLTVARHLLERKADPNQRTDQEGMTPLMLAVNSNYAPMVSMLLEYKALPNLADRFAEPKQTTIPLIAAARSGSTDIVKLLLEAKAEPDHADQQRCVALEEAVRSEKLLITGLLLDKYASITAPRNLYYFLEASDPREPYTLLALETLSRHQKHSRELQLNDGRQLKQAEYKNLVTYVGLLSAITADFKTNCKVPITLLSQAVNESLLPPLLEIISEYDYPFERSYMSRAIDVTHFFKPKVRPEPTPPPPGCCCVM